MNEYQKEHVEKMIKRFKEGKPKRASYSSGSSLEPKKIRGHRASCVIIGEYAEFEEIKKYKNLLAGAPMTVKFQSNVDEYLKEEEKE